MKIQTDDLKTAIDAMLQCIPSETLTGFIYKLSLPVQEKEAISQYVRATEALRRIQK